MQNYLFFNFLAGWIFVEWDNGQTFDYRYGNNGLMVAYDLTVCDEPRHIPENQTIATGCLVRRGNINLIIVSQDELVNT